MNEAKAMRVVVMDADGFVVGMVFSAFTQVVSFWS